jgi:hypothetical protein
MAFHMTWPRRSTVPFIDSNARRSGGRPALLALAALLLSGCGQLRTPAPPATSTATPATPSAAAQGTEPAPQAPGHTAGAAAPDRRPLRPVAHWDDYRLQAAERLVEASPGGTYAGPVPEPLLAIPVLEIELNGDGSVRRITVTRKPSQALDTVQLAIDAVHRAAPFGPVTHLPRPWKFTEVFLFDDHRRFKPRSLDL